MIPGVIIFSLFHAYSLNIYQKLLNSTQVSINIKGADTDKYKFVKQLL